MQDPCPELNVGLSRTRTCQVLAQSKVVIQVQVILGRSSLGPLLSTQKAVKTLGQPQIRVKKPHIGPQTQEGQLDSSPRTQSTQYKPGEKGETLVEKEDPESYVTEALQKAPLPGVLVHSH